MQDAICNGTALTHDRLEEHLRYFGNSMSMVPEPRAKELWRQLELSVARYDRYGGLAKNHRLHQTAVVYFGAVIESEYGLSLSIMRTCAFIQPLVSLLTSQNVDAADLFAVIPSVIAIATDGILGITYELKPVELRLALDLIDFAGAVYKCIITSVLLNKPNEEYRKCAILSEAL